MECTIYCDESIKQGKYYGNFYGGALVFSKHQSEVLNGLKVKKEELFGSGEVKWSKVSPLYLDKYKEMMKVFFDFIEADKVKLRVMFTKNSHIPIGLTAEQIKNDYFILYYHFLKYAFGLRYSNQSEAPFYLRLYFDQLPDTKSKIQTFKGFIHNLQNLDEFKKANICIRHDDIAEINSKQHVILQCCDVVTGAMQFRLNDLHKEKPDGQRCRAKKTIAKDSLYKYIRGRIGKIYPGFNIGDSTGRRELNSLWIHQYRHWKFISTNSSYDGSKCKPK